MDAKQRRSRKTRSSRSRRRTCSAPVLSEPARNPLDRGRRECVLEWRSVALLDKAPRQQDRQWRARTPEGEGEWRSRPSSHCTSVHGRDQRLLQGEQLERASDRDAEGAGVSGSTASSTRSATSSACRLGGDRHRSSMSPSMRSRRGRRKRGHNSASAGRLERTRSPCSCASSEPASQSDRLRSGRAFETKRPWPSVASSSRNAKLPDLVVAADHFARRIRNDRRKPAVRQGAGLYSAAE